MGKISKYSNLYDKNGNFLHKQRRRLQDGGDSKESIKVYIGIPYSPVS